jgi:hypothetical protein
MFFLSRTVDTIPTCVGMATEGGGCPFIKMEMSGMCLLGPYQLPQTLNTWCWCSTSPPFEVYIIYFKKKTGAFNRKKREIIVVNTQDRCVADPDTNPDPDSHVFGPPGSGSISQRYGSGSFYHHAKK